MAAEIKIRKYTSKDFKELANCMLGLHKFLLAIDTFKILRKPYKNFGKAYSLALLKKVHKNNGIILLAEYQKKIVGCIAGGAEKQSKESRIEQLPIKTGLVWELYVAKGNRSKGIGKLLMKEIEKYFRKHKCDEVELLVFGTNKLAHNFYQKLGYRDRAFEMTKTLK